MPLPHRELNLRLRLRLAVACPPGHPDLREDWPLLRAALAARGVDATTRAWNDPGARWDDVDLVLANGAWDNIHHPGEFAAWVARVDSQTRMVNPPGVLRWNADKRYLDALSRAGVPTVPTSWLGPGDPLPDLGEGEIVVKPTVSGGGHETARYLPDERGAACAHIERLHRAGRGVMVQPYQAAVDAQGEIGLVFIGGEYSHAVAKGALLEPGAGVQADLYLRQRVTPCEPTAVQLAAARAALSAADGLAGATAYARVDLVTLAEGGPGVLELELLDPALFLELAPDPPAAAARFAAVLAG